MIAAVFAIEWNTAAVWLISLLAIALVLMRPRELPEAWWATGGAAALLLLGLISPLAARRAVSKGFDVYLFLTGMMIVSELARREGVFRWLAGQAVRACRGSRIRLFILIYAVGTVVTVFLSNDTTAVVLTPAVLAAVKAADAEPLPYLLICAFIANAASFVLPISNPANLVVYRTGMPALGAWLATFGLPSMVAILVTFVLLLWLTRAQLRRPVRSDFPTAPLSANGQLALFGIAFMAMSLMVASALHADLGVPACGVGLLAMLAVAMRDAKVPKDIVRNISWSVLPLVASLFVIVEALNDAGALRMAVKALEEIENWPQLQAALASGFGIALLSNAMNNLPSGLIAGSAVHAAHATNALRSAVLIGVDLGPNLSVTGSLATILWLMAIRREGETIGFWKFLQYGAVVMPPALLLALVMLR